MNDKRPTALWHMTEHVAAAARLNLDLKNYTPTRRHRMDGSIQERLQRSNYAVHNIRTRILIENAINTRENG